MSQAYLYVSTAGKRALAPSVNCSSIQWSHLRERKYVPALEWRRNQTLTHFKSLPRTVSAPDECVLAGVALHVLNIKVIVVVEVKNKSHTVVESLGGEGLR